MPDVCHARVRVHTHICDSVDVLDCIINDAVCRRLCAWLNYNLVSTKGGSHIQLCINQPPTSMLVDFVILLLL